VSPDGKRVAVAIDGQGIWLWDLVRRNLIPMTSDSSRYAFGPVWTRDGHSLLFFSLTGLFRQPTDGIGAAGRIGSGIPSDVTPDGTRVIFSPGARDIMVMGLDATRQVPLVQTPFNERNGVVSPDGHWLTYESDRSGRFEIYVQPFLNGVSEGERLISMAGGTRPLWAPGGRELFYVAPDGAVIAVGVDSRGDTWSIGRPVKVVEGPYSTLSSSSPRTYDVSRDGRRFLVVRQPATQIAAQIVVVQNWTEELKARVPRK
jgi:Tol biopolymer transport system component